MILVAIAALAGTPPLVPPVTEIDHPTYRDATERVVQWSEIRQATSEDALTKVHRRRAGRTLLRGMFLGATALEAWGTTRLFQQEHWAAWPLLGQTTATGICSVLMFTGVPAWRHQDRAILLNGLPAAAYPPPTPVIEPGAP